MNQIEIYQTKDKQTEIEVKFEEDTVWLTQKKMAELFQTTSQNITIHLKNVYKSGELQEVGTCKEYLQVQTEGKRSKCCILCTTWADHDKAGDESYPQLISRKRQEKPDYHPLS